MSCKQTLYDGRMPDGLTPLEYLSNKSTLTQCAQECCDDSECYTYTYKADTKECWLWPRGDSFIYIPTKSNVPESGDVFMTTGILQNRKQRELIPFILILIAIAVFFLWRWKNQSAPG